MGISAISLSDSDILRSLEEEELRLRRLEPIGPVAPAVPIQPVVRTEGLSAVSTIEKAAEKERPAKRPAPVLEAPKHYMYGILQAHQGLERVCDKQSRIFESQMKVDMAEIDRLELEKTQKLKQQLESAKSEKNWGIFNSVIQYIASGASIALGAACMATGIGVGAGMLLVGSGILGLAARVMHDTGAFKTIASWFTQSIEMQKSIASKIEMGMFFLSCGMGLGGGAWAYKAGAYAAAALTSRIALVKKFSEGIGLATSVGGASARFGLAVIEKKTSDLQATVQVIETKSNEIYQKIYQEGREVQNLLDTTRDIGEEVKNAISASVVQQD